MQKIGGDFLDIGYTHAIYLIAMGLLIFAFGYASDRSAQMAINEPIAMIGRQ